MIETLHDHPAVKMAFRDNKPRNHKALTRLYEQWAEWNIDLFDSSFDAVITPLIMIEPMVTAQGGIGCYRGPHGHCRELDDPKRYPRIWVCEEILTGEGHSMSKKGEEYSEGRFRYVADAMLHEMVHEFCQDLKWIVKTPYSEALLQDFDRRKDFAKNTSDAIAEHATNHGVLFCLKCNQIGDRLGLPHVTVTDEVDYPVDPEDWEDGDEIPDIPEPDAQPFCNYWPHNVRPDGYYMNAITKDTD